MPGEVQRKRDITARGEAAMMELREITRLDELEALGPEWDALFEASPTLSPSCWHPWVMSWYEGFVAPEEMAVWAFTEGDALVGAIPLVRRRLRVAGVTLRLLESASSFIDSPSFDVLSRDPEALVGVFCDRLASLRRDWDVVHTRCVPMESALWRVLPDLATARGLRVVLAPKGRSRVLDTSAAGSVLATSVARKSQRQLKYLQADGSVDFGTISEPAALEAALHELMEMEARSYKGELGDAVLCRADRARFFASLHRRAASRGGLRVDELSVGNCLVASQLVVIVKGICHLLRMAYDQNMARYSPGSVLYRWVLEECCRSPLLRAMNNGASYPGDWKERWGGDLVPFGDVVILGRSPRARAYEAQLALRDVARRCTPVSRLYWRWRNRGGGS